MKFHFGPKLPLPSGNCQQYVNMLEKQCIILGGGVLKLHFFSSFRYIYSSIDIHHLMFYKYYYYGRLPTLHGFWIWGGGIFSITFFFLSSLIQVD